MPTLNVYITQEEFDILNERATKTGSRNVCGQIRELISKELFPVEKPNIEMEVNAKLGYVTIYDWDKADMVVFSGTLVNAVRFLLRRQYPDHNLVIKEEGTEPRHR